MAGSLKSVSTGGKAFKWEGITEMKKMWAEFAIALGEEGMGTARAELKDALIKPAYVIRDEAKDLCPYNPKRKEGIHLRDAIFATKGPDDKKGVIVGVNLKKAPHGILVEKGTSRMQAHPYFRPAVTATRPLVANMISGDMKKLIEGMANKLGYHPPKTS